MKVTGPEAAASLLMEKAAGLEIEMFQVFGINSLKTVVEPGVVVGLHVANVEVRNDKILIDLGDYTVQVDLQRTGAVVWTAPDVDSTPQPRPATATGRIRFTDGSVASFVEPAKTKRIAFWILKDA